MHKRLFYNLIKVNAPKVYNLSGESLNGLLLPELIMKRMLPLTFCEPAA